MSKIEVNTVEPQCGTTLTLGGSGDTVTLATGASQSGFGRTGTVDWQTGSIKTSTFTAANGEGYFANTSGGAFTMNLPAGTAGNIVSVVDYTNSFQTHNLTISPNGSEKIGGVADDTTLSTEGQSVTFVYVDGTEGWKNVQDSTSNVIGRSFLTATGGTITTSGDDKIHKFTGPGTFTVTSASSNAPENIVSYMVVAGGGGGGYDEGGGGGAGGYRELKSPTTPYTASPLDGYATAPNRVTVTATGYPITVGAGGAGASTPAPGANSVFSTITSAGGGAGARSPLGSPSNAGVAGGSGGGSRGSCGPGGAGNTPPTTPAQGFAGAAADAGGGTGGAGGGGATSIGIDAGPAGAGATTSISASPTIYAGGGAGAPGGSGGPGGGGNAATPGTVNTGGGGGGGDSPTASAPTGGSGIVIIRYKFQ